MSRTAQFFSATGWPIVLAVIGGITGLLLAVLIGITIRRTLRRSPELQLVTARGRVPLRTTLVLIGVELGLRSSTRPSDWRTIADHAFVLALIAGVTWLLTVIAGTTAEVIANRFRTDATDNRHARRVRTQITVLRRIAVTVIVVIGLGAALFTFPGLRVAGAGVLTSAGLISIVAGLAAQSALANVFAGLQLAFTDAIRVEDVVVVNNYWGRIDEITLTYVVVRVWDDRNVILPSTWFTTTPFENWTRKSSQLLGTVELDLDWSIPVDEVRTLVDAVLSRSEKWDERVGVVQVTDAVGSFVRVRVLVSAADSPTLFDLRCEVREALVGWVSAEHPQSLPRLRVGAVTRGPSGPDVTGDLELGAVPGPDSGSDRTLATTVHTPTSRPLLTATGSR